MAEAVYTLCALTSIVCAVLLAHGYHKSRVPLLLWAALCFVGLALNNVILFVDLVMLPEHDLGILRSSVALAAICILLFGLIWEKR
jgi:hydrogenase/urease accessory protein HupE